MIENASEHGAGGAPASSPPPAVDSSFMSAGDMLRQARESHGVALEVVAAALKVTPQKLAALEADDIGALPDPVFARALAASICRAFRMDPAPVLAKMPGSSRDGLADADRTISASLRSSAHRSGSAAGRLPSRSLLIVVALVLIAAAVLFWLPQSSFERLSASIGRMTSSGASGSAASDAKPASSVDGNVVESVTPAVPAVAAAPVAPAPVVVAPPPEPPASSAPLVFVAKEESWVTVNDAGGKPLLRRTIKAGETVPITGTLPFSVTVGRASGMTVQVRGKPFDLAPLTRAGGVARFEVKP